MVYIPKGIYNPSICLYYILPNIKYDSLVALKIEDLSLHFFQTKSNVCMFRKIISANFDGFFKADVSKK